MAEFEYKNVGSIIIQHKTIRKLLFNSPIAINISYIQLYINTDTSTYIGTINGNSEAVIHKVEKLKIHHDSKYNIYHAKAYINLFFNFHKNNIYNAIACMKLFFNFHKKPKSF